MLEKVHLRPSLGQVRYRLGTAPNYQLASPGNVAQLAGRLAEIFNLKATSFNFNQNALSAQFLSFRYIFPFAAPGIPLTQLPYLDVALGVDQVELLFSNPPSVQLVRETYLRTLEAIIAVSSPNITDHYLEASLHAPGDNVNIRQFFDNFVTIPTKLPIEKGFAFSLTLENNARAAMNLDTSILIKGGVFIFFTYTHSVNVKDLSSIDAIIDSAVGVYREFQSVANIEIEEPAEIPT